MWLVLSVALLVALGGFSIALLRRVRGERELFEAERRLARVSVEEQTIARQRAEQSEAVSRELIQLLGRELRTPLASIRGFARALSEHDDDLEPLRRKEFFAVIRRQSNRLIRVIEDLMLAARLAAGESGLARESVDVAGLMADTLSELDPPTTHRIVTTCAPELPRVRGERGELRQALLALLENAIQFSPGGGVVELAALLVSGWVEISVRDQGVGVPAETRDSIFDLLGKPSDDGQGLGVGLFLVRGVAERCGGEVRYEPAQGGGSMFTLRLPSADSLLTPDRPRATIKPS